jgi:hypothetical protein
MAKDYTELSNDFIKSALEVAAAEYSRLMGKRYKVEQELAEIDRDVARLSFKVVSLATLCDEIPKDIAVVETLKDVSKTGLTEAIRIVLRASGEWMTAMQIRDQILKLGVGLSKHKNPLASIYTILHRLDKEVEMATAESTSKIMAKYQAAQERGEKGFQAVKAKFVYRWKGPVETVWERLNALPREKANEIVKETADTIAKEHWRKQMRSPKKTKKKEACF